MPDGALTLRISATDADGNEVSTDVPVCVGGPCETSDEGETGETGETGDGDTTDEAGGTEGSNDEVGDTSSANEDGGGCTTTDAGRSAPFLLLGIAGLFALRRRSRA